MPMHGHPPASSPTVSQHCTIRTARSDRSQGERGGGAGGAGVTSRSQGSTPKARFSTGLIFLFTGRIMFRLLALTLMATAHTCSGFIPAASAVSRIPRPVLRSQGANNNGRHVGACSPPTGRTRPRRTLKNGAADSSDDIDLSAAMANARANLAAGTSTHPHSRSLSLVLHSNDVASN